MPCNQEIHMLSHYYRHTNLVIAAFYINITNVTYPEKIVCCKNYRTR